MKHEDNNKSFIERIIEFINEEIYDFSDRKSKKEIETFLSDDKSELKVKTKDERATGIGPIIPLDTHEEPEKENLQTKIFDAETTPHLDLIKGFLPERQFPLTEIETTLGRSNANTIVLSDKSASRNHAKIVKMDDGYYIYDLESTNGVIINGEQVSEQRLSNHDIIVIGEFTFEFVMPGGELALPIPHAIEVSLDENELITIGKQRNGFFEKLVPRERRMRFFIIMIFFVVVIGLLFMLKKDKNESVIPGITKEEGEHSREKGKRFEFTFAQGKDFLEKEKYEEALQAFTVAQKLDPTNEDVIRYKKRAETAIELQQEIKNEDAAEKQEEERKDRIERMEREGIQFYNEYNYTKAEEVFLLLLKEDSDNEVAKKYVALIKEITSSAYKEKLKVKEEQELVKEQIEVAQGLYDKGEIYQALTEMRKVFNFAVDLSEYRDKIEARIETWEKELKDKLAEKLQHAKTLWENGEKKEARSLLKEILKQYPDYTAAREESERIEESLKEEAFKYYNEGRIYEYNDDIKSAIENYEKVINLLDRDDEYYKKADEQLKKIR